ncbi:Mitochondrial escape protein 2 [Symbiodinium microadriaticum]|uniref:Mitochondrial escape protein 2 n=1 Tax=Symbiodinium microadriaticum TaxID=2951 RepID=A0A1Q9F4T0_SYMMI|nr:Mitochondrial escape protein 2 [Symbiodinium microadriaticum]
MHLGRALTASMGPMKLFASDHEAVTEYPTKVFRFDFRQMLTHHNHETLIPQLLPDGVEAVTKMVPREREGGAFVYFRAPPTFVLQAFLCPQPVRAHRVKGTPYLEVLWGTMGCNDVTSETLRYPSSQIHIKFEPAAEKKPTEEQVVYEVLRRYGQLDELTASEDGYTARFRCYVSGGVAARNCLHRAPLQLEGQDGPVTTFCIEYKQFVQKWTTEEGLSGMKAWFEEERWLWETLTANARFVFPLFVVFMPKTFCPKFLEHGGLRKKSFPSAFVHLRLAAIFSSVPSRSDSEHGEGDPHYTGATGLALRGLHGALRGLREEAIARRLERHRQSTAEPLVASDGSLFDDFWSERKSEITELQVPFSARMLTFITTRGHRVLEINVRDMLEVGGAADDHLFLRSFSRSVGQVNGKDDEDDEEGDDEEEKQDGDENGCALHFDATPLILITGFTSENKALVSWAAYVALTQQMGVSEAKLARVVFVADSSFGEPSILSHLKDRPERLSVLLVVDLSRSGLPIENEQVDHPERFQLQDVTESSVRRILVAYGFYMLLEQEILIERRLTPDKMDLSDEHLKAIGGRYMDIAALLGHMRRMDAKECSKTSRSLAKTSPPFQRGHGVAADEAVRWLLETAEVTVRRLLLTGQPGALRSMKESNLIAINPRKSESSWTLRYDVEAGSPLYAEVFRRLVQNEGLAAVLDLEAELVKIEEILDARRDWWWLRPSTDSKLEKRREQLVDLIMEQHKKLEKYHKARRKAGVYNAAAVVFVDMVGGGWDGDGCG